MAAPTFAWLGGEVHAEVVLGVLAVAAAYTWATIASRRPTPLGPPITFFAGCAALLGALNGPLHDLSDYYLFSAHMVSTSYSRSSSHRSGSPARPAGCSTRSRTAPRRSPESRPCSDG